MAKFYGQVFGSKTDVHTQGTDEIKVSAQSYDGSIIVKLDYNDDKDLRVRIEANYDSASSGETIFVGTFDEFLNLFEADEIAYNNLIKILDYYTICLDDKLVKLMSIRCAQNDYDIIDYIELAQELRSSDDVLHTIFEFGLIDKEELEELRKKEK